ncbi:MAG TPA: hypothetical protein VLE74_01455 [Candidatus Saccharimonadales bacterium]|nr:hypothetical protein [Candidatus Saccharimonadales bacterium]
MLHRVVPVEKYAGLDDEAVFEQVLRSVGRRGVDKELLFTGFEGADVAKQRSFGERWHTFALTSEEVGERFEYGGDTILDFVHLRGRRLPALAVFDGAILEPVTMSNALGQRYREETGNVPDIGEIYGVDGPSLDMGALAVFYFEPERSGSLTGQAS